MLGLHGQLDLFDEVNNEILFKETTFGLHGQLRII